MKWPSIAALHDVNSGALSHSAASAGGAVTLQQLDDDDDFMWSRPPRQGSDTGAFKEGPFLGGPGFIWAN